MFITLALAKTKLLSVYKFLKKRNNYLKVKDK